APRRSSVFGLPPSHIHTSLVPSGLTISTWIHVCGLIHSIFTILPLRITGRLASNSDPKAWCAASGTAMTHAATAVNRKSVQLLLCMCISMYLSFRTGLGRFLFLAQARALQNIRHCVIPFMARVFVDVSLRFRPTVLAGPGLCPGLGIVDREA